MSCQGPVLQCIWVSGATLTTANELPSHVCPHRDAWDDATPHCASAASCSRRERSQAPHSRLLTWERTILHVVDQVLPHAETDKTSQQLGHCLPQQASAICPERHGGQHELLSCTRCTCPAWQHCYQARALLAIGHRTALQCPSLAPAQYAAGRCLSGALRSCTTSWVQHI